MLQQAPQTEQAPSPALIRVTPEELARALATIEARKEQASRDGIGTISIGEAVQQLGFDVTSEEIWTEVQAGRVREADHKSRRRRLPPAAAGLALLTLGALGYVRLHQNLTRPPQGPSSAPPPVKQPNVRNQNISVTEQTPNGPQVELLSEVPDGHSVRCTYDDASKITPGYLARSYGSPLPIDGSEANVLWTLIKYGGRVYLRGWPKDHVSPGALGLVGLTVFSSRSAAGEHAIPVTLRIGGFDSNISQGTYGTDGGFEAITVTHIHPDERLWERP